MLEYLHDTDIMYTDIWKFDEKATEQQSPASWRYHLGYAGMTDTGICLYLAQIKLSQVEDSILDAVIYTKYFFLFQTYPYTFQFPCVT